MKEDKKTFRKILNLVLANEGYSITDIKNDHGGKTYCGVTQKTYDQFRVENDLEPQIVADMTGDELEDIYYSYYNDCKCQLMSPDVAYQVFDIAVNCGSNRASKILQKSLIALGYTLTVDGVIGAFTLKVISGVPSLLLVDHIIIQRKKFYAKLVDNDKTQNKFYDGWIARSNKRYCA